MHQETMVSKLTPVDLAPYRRWFDNQVRELVNENDGRFAVAFT